MLIWIHIVGLHHLGCLEIPEMAWTPNQPLKHKMFAVFPHSPHCLIIIFPYFPRFQLPFSMPCERSFTWAKVAALERLRSCTSNPPPCRYGPSSLDHHRSSPPTESSLIITILNPLGGFQLL